MLGSAQARFEGGWALAADRLVYLSQPRQVRTIRRGLCVLAVIWLLWVLAKLIWLALPAPIATAPEKIVNPMVAGAGSRATAAVDIEKLAAWDLFGTPSSQLIAAVEVEPEANEVPAGIEDGAQETRLNLRLQGLVASTDPDQARAIIEHQKRQEQYAVGEKLPVSGSVKLAKVLPDRVVLDNSGKYELLMLFDESEISSAPLQAQPREELDPEDGDAQTRIDQRGRSDVTEMAESYRQRIYKDPTSLAQAVRISAQRVNGQLQGYRVSPGKDRQQFEQLGFKPNDVVTGVNGVELTDPGKAMELYKVMRTASEANFSVLRDGAEITLVVGLDGAGDSD